METTLTKKGNETSQIGLDTKKSQETAKLLNNLLGNYSVFYQNVRGYHWNLKGPKFFELHIKFEELYTYLYKKIDDVAERITTLGYQANYNFSDYNSMSIINEAKEANNGITAAEDILSSLRLILSLERRLLISSSENKDEGTYNLMSDHIKEQEKIAWMYSSFLAK